MEEVAKHNTQDDCWLVIGNDSTGEIYGGTSKALFFTLLFFRRAWWPRRLEGDWRGKSRRSDVGRCGIAVDCFGGVVVKSIAGSGPSRYFLVSSTL